LDCNSPRTRYKLDMPMPRPHCQTSAFARGRALRLPAALALFGLGLALGDALPAAVVSVQDQGKGNEYMSGEPITLPAGCLSTNLFTNGVQVIRNRAHTARPAAFDVSGRLLMEAAPSPNGFPAYLVGQQFVWFLQNVRHYTNYACAVKVDCPCTLYLLVDNRVNDYGSDSPFDDPTFGPPDTQWILDDGWQRVNTGLTPSASGASAGDYVGIDEGNNNTLNNFYAVYCRTLKAPGAVTLRTELDGNMYCLVVSTNVVRDTVHPVPKSAVKESATR
jgi:hypothetical protein